MSYKVDYKNRCRYWLPALLLSQLLVLAACGGSSSSDSNNSDSVTPSTSLSGTAAAGAPIIGTVTVRGSLGNSKSALIEADGTYDVDVTGLTAPYRLRAQGTVGGKTYKLHSYAEEADVGGTVNITPFTDLIVANVAGDLAENFFDSDINTSLDQAEVDAQEEALQAKLQDVFDVLGLGTAIDLLNDSFSADHSGLDAALDIISIEVDSGTNIATIKNLVEDTQIVDDITDSEDNTESLQVVDSGALTESVSDTQQIADLFTTLATKYSTGVPSSNDTELANLFSDDFIDYDQSKGAFLTDITTDPTLIGLDFASVSISNLDSTAGTAEVSFNVVFNGEIDPETETWLAAKDEILGWQLRGNQRIVDTYFSFHCNDFDGEDANPGGCGINTQVWDEDFSNNGTNGAPIASARVSIINGTDGVTVRDEIYLGTPDFADAGNVQVYNEADGQYYGDWRAFGTGLGETDSSIIAAGDIARIELYTTALDVSTQSAPQVTGSVIATYEQTIDYVPSLVGLYPTATGATLTALDNFSLGDDLTVSWTLAEGTVSDEVLFEVSDGLGNRIEIWDESFSSSALSTTFSATDIADTASAESVTLDPEAVSYELLVRIYAMDANGQFHSTDYRRTIDGPAATGGGTGGGDTGGGDTGGGETPSLACNVESGWDEQTDPLGQPITPYSYADFQAAVADCGGATVLTKADVAGKSFADGEETFVFNDTGAATEGDPSTGSLNDLEGSIAYQWWIDSNGYVVLYSDATIDPALALDIGNDFWFRETAALVDSGTGKFAKYTEQFNYAVDDVRETGVDGEVWYQFLTEVP